jgi:hypothetical protein
MLLFLVGAGLFLSAAGAAPRRWPGDARPAATLDVLHPGRLSALGGEVKLPDPLYTLYLVNPMAGIVDTFRRSLILQQSPDSVALSIAAGVVLVLLPITYTYFNAELTMADVI